MGIFRCRAWRRVARRRLSLSAALVLSSVAAGCREKRSAAEAVVERGACPGECCTYGAWLALAALPAYAAPGDTTVVAFTIAKGDSLTADSGHVDRCS
jgi:hypothetical protein